MQGTMMDYPLTLAAVLERAGRLFGKTEIVSRLPDRSLHRTDYAAVERRARALAAGLARAGLQRGDRVATLMWNHYAHLECYFGVPVAGGILHTLNLRLHPSELAYIVQNAEDRFLVMDDVLLPLFRDFQGQVHPEKVFVVRHNREALPAGCEDYESLLAAGDAGFRAPELDENDGAAMCYTSGTTGKPKGVVYSHRALVLHSLGFALPDAFAISHHDTVMAIQPMFHANAWGVPYCATLVGAKQVLPGPFVDAESLLELFTGERVTFAGGVPTVWQRVLEALDAQPGRWKGLAGMRLVVAGSAVPESMIRRFDEHGMRVIHLWGMTEMTPAGTVANLKRHMHEWDDDRKYEVRAKQGLPLPFVEARVVNERGEVPWDGQSLGELQVRGPAVAREYYRLPEEHDKWTADGWFRTGDIASLDAEGYLKIADRTKDMIKSGGEWISSVDLENALMGHPAVKEAAVIAVPHAKWDERPLAVVVPKDGVEPAPEELRQFLSTRFAKWQLPDAFVFVAALPHTSTGKLLKSKLREEYRQWQWRQSIGTGD